MSWMMDRIRTISKVGKWRPACFTRMDMKEKRRAERAWVGGWSIIAYFHQFKKIIETATRYHQSQPSNFILPPTPLRVLGHDPLDSHDNLAFQPASLGQQRGAFGWDFFLFGPDGVGWGGVLRVWHFSSVHSNGRVGNENLGSKGFF